jgi:hypothetical protein
LSLRNLVVTVGGCVAGSGDVFLSSVEVSLTQLEKVGADFEVVARLEIYVIDMERNGDERQTLTERA